MIITGYYVRTVLQYIGYEQSAAIKKPMITNINMKKILNWTKEFSQKDDSWSAIMRSNERKLC